MENFSDSRDSFDDVDLGWNTTHDLEDEYRIILLLFSSAVVIATRSLSSSQLLLISGFRIVYPRYRGLDLRTLHQTLPESHWGRHERRSKAKQYKPSKEFGRYKPALKNWQPIRKTNKYVVRLSFLG